MHIN
jgi:hypothetical protein